MRNSFTFHLFFSQLCDNPEYVVRVCIDETKTSAKKNPVQFDAGEPKIRIFRSGSSAQGER